MKRNDYGVPGKILKKILDRALEGIPEIILREISKKPEKNLCKKSKRTHRKNAGINS